MFSTHPEPKLLFHLQKLSTWTGRKFCCLVNCKDPTEESLQYIVGKDGAVQPPLLNASYLRSRLKTYWEQEKMQVTPLPPQPPPPPKKKKKERERESMLKIAYRWKDYVLIFLGCP